MTGVSNELGESISQTSVDTNTSLQQSKPAHASRSNAMPLVDIYTDGACSGNPGPGGWAGILISKGSEKVISGGEPATTNNRMELTAAVEALKCLKKPCKVRLFSDSAYLVSAFNLGWLAKWQRNGWRNAANDPVSNPDLWQALLQASAPHSIDWIKVKGHADNEYNNRCDKLAVAEIKKRGSNDVE